MIDGKPNYTRLSTIAMADVVLMNQDDRTQFINALCEMFENIHNPDYCPEEKPGFVGRSIARQFAEFREGTKKYMENVNRNPSGLSNRNRNPVGNPVGNPVAKRTETPKEIEIEKEKEKKRKKFIPPTVEEVSEYCRDLNSTVDPENFCDYYAARGWELKPGQKMKDWKASIRYWERNQKGGRNGGGSAINKTENGAAYRTDYSFLQNGES